MMARSFSFTLTAIALTLWSLCPAYASVGHPLSTEQTASPEEALKSTIPSVPAIQQPHIASALECLFCEFVIYDIDSYLTANSTVNEITNVVKDICSHMPNEDEVVECQDFISTYGPEIIELLARRADPDTICTYLGICNGTTPILGVAQQPQVPRRSDDCITCSFMKSTLNYFVRSRMHKAKIEIFQDISGLEAHLEASCKSLIDPYQAKCEQMTSILGSEMMTSAVQRESSKHFCQAKNYCPMVKDN